MMTLPLVLAIWPLLFALAAAETGLDGWLRYARIPRADEFVDRLPSRILVFNATQSNPVYTAASELKQGIEGIIGKSLDISTDWRSTTPAFVLGTIGALGLDHAADVKLTHNQENQRLPYATDQQHFGTGGDLIQDGFSIDIDDEWVQISAVNERGVLYGAFTYLSQLAQGNLPSSSYTSNPDAPLRWTNEWDNLDGSIERGYGGVSIFFANGTIVEDLTRAALYARLVASIGNNAIVVNNVNSNAEIFSAKNIDGLGRIADVFRSYGIQLGVAANFAAPKTLGELSTFDPLDKDVIEWWDNVTDRIYDRIPDFAGYLSKANLEGQPGPLTYNRTFAEGANMYAKALKKHGGIVMFRAFVWVDMDYDDWHADRAKTANEYFEPLDGQFDDNVVVQIKYGPIDFQVREPTSPLFANLRNTSVAIEVQPSPEYLGQNCHYVYLAPLWKTVYDFDLRVDNQTSLVRDIVAGRRFNRPLGGYAGVAGVGSNMSWLGHHLSMSNIYAFGRLAWNPRLSAEDISKEWTRLTFGTDEAVIEAINKISMQSWQAYENYSGPLGIQTLTDILYTHFGPGVATQDGNIFGQWTRSDRFGLGMDRTAYNGTGYAAQYPPEIAKMYENISMTPEELLLWFHHVNYTHVLKSGETVLQHFYDAHYDGAETVQQWLPLWESLKGKIDEQRYEEVLFRLQFQAGHSIVWRDAINGYYRNLSGIADKKDRVWNHPWRLEAESMQLDGYELYHPEQPETASNATAIVVSEGRDAGSASAILSFPEGTYTLVVNFFDLIDGISEYTVLVNEQVLAFWKADWIDGPNPKLGHEQSRRIDGNSATRINLGKVDIKPGDMLRMIGKPDGIERAPLDYVVFLPDGVID